MNFTYFYKSKRIKSGYVSYCKTCHWEMTKEWRNKNKDRHNGNQKNDYVKNKEKRVRYSISYKKRNITRVRNNNNASSMRSRMTVNEAYINKLIKQRGVDPSSISLDLKETLKESILLQRKFKSLKDGANKK